VRIRPPRCDPVLDLEYFDGVAPPSHALTAEDEDARVDVDDSHADYYETATEYALQKAPMPAAMPAAASGIRITASLGYTLAPVSAPFRPAPHASPTPTA
jgi:hypothetical protein